MEFLSILLVIAAVLIWRRIGALERRLEQFEKILYELQRGAINVPPTPRAEAPTVSAAQAPAAAMKEIRAVESPAPNPGGRCGSNSCWPMASPRRW